MGELYRSPLQLQKVEPERSMPLMRKSEAVASRGHWRQQSTKDASRQRKCRRTAVSEEVLAEASANLEARS